MPHLRSVLFDSQNMSSGEFNIFSMFFSFIAAVGFFVSSLCATSSSSSYHNFQHLWECEEFSSEPATQQHEQRKEIITQNHERKKFFDFRFNVNSVSRSFKPFFSPRTLILHVQFSSTRSLRSFDFDFEAQQHSLSTLPWWMESKLIRCCLAPKKSESQPNKFKLKHSCDFHNGWRWLLFDCLLNSSLFSDTEQFSRASLKELPSISAFPSARYCLAAFRTHSRRPFAHPARSFLLTTLSVILTWLSIQMKICEISKQLKRNSPFRQYQFLQLRILLDVRQRS